MSQFLSKNKICTGAVQEYRGSLRKGLCAQVCNTGYLKHMLYLIIITLLRDAILIFDRFEY
jgi:hypothetical protein